jgi:hypothetical protein
VTRRVLAGLCTVLIATLSSWSPVEAYGSPSYGITEFEALTSGPISFTVVDITNPALLGSQSYIYDLQGATSNSGGTVTITAPTIIGSSGKRIPPGAFTATCTQLYDRDGSFNPSGAVTLSSSPVTCARIASSSSIDASFTVTLTLNCGTSSAVAIPADTYTDSDPLTVTANTP